jgi:hypothetical protein
MEDTMDILHIERKGPLINTLERFHIYNLSKENIQMNDINADTYNPICNLITNYHKIPYQPPPFTNNQSHNIPTHPPPLPNTGINTHATTKNSKKNTLSPLTSRPEA